MPGGGDHSEKICQYSFNSCFYEEASSRTRRRKRLPNSRNSQQGQSTDTTSDDDNTIHSQQIQVAHAASENYPKFQVSLYFFGNLKYLIIFSD